jgi:hypothetical protein
MESGGRGSIREDEIAAFSEKLAYWANSLPPEEQALARLLLARAQLARELDTTGDFSFEPREPWVQLVNSVFGDIVKPKPDIVVDPDGAAIFMKESGPLWNKGAWVDTADVPAPEASPPADRPEHDAETALSGFADHLDEYAGTLSAREQQVLVLVLLRAMDPLDRVRWTSDPAILDEGQQALLRELDEQPER